MGKLRNTMIASAMALASTVAVQGQQGIDLEDECLKDPMDCDLYSYVVRKDTEWRKSNELDKGCLPVRVGWYILEHQEIMSNAVFGDSRNLWLMDGDSVKNYISEVFFSVEDHNNSIRKLGEEGFLGDVSDSFSPASLVCDNVKINQNYLESRLIRGYNNFFNYVSKSAGSIRKSSLRNREKSNEENVNR
ncbi:hypothetical protein GOV11_00300 [Candidatus Woesearchaeota archaeon]|nr:hypothetical protein [Candidatus Woesearchaeota archaeon]